MVLRAPPSRNPKTREKPKTSGVWNLGPSKCIRIEGSRKTPRIQGISKEEEKD